MLLSDCPRQAANRRRAGRPAPAHAGFTLVELMITLVVLGVLVGMAAPSFSNLINSNRLTAAANEVVAAMQVARMEAVRRNANVVLCPSTDGAACAGTAWREFIVFADEDGDNTVDAGTDEVIRTVAVTESGIAVNASSNLATNHRLRFGADGFARVGNAGARNGGLSVCSGDVAQAENTRHVLVAVSRINVQIAGVAACGSLTD
ncbi:GspH/FimT family pseudopilin [Novilysobacter arseniciresistens]|uniref:GspH/FimT family pseudopilin n=1 Tax=Novilysobacter arseniciresistens TaxID=1385522 RepID=UPI0009DC9A29|nr:GspH/FimT family pseudopilin [Lysobacter arseniciresistens]